MTSTERAALRLALGVLRMARPRHALWALREAASTLYVANVDDLGTAIDATVNRGDVPLRLVRARVALFLRAVLRAKSGDFGAIRCRRCHARHRMLEDGAPGSDCDCHMIAYLFGLHRLDEYAPVRPLWTQARRHEP